MRVSGLRLALRVFKSQAPAKLFQRRGSWLAAQRTLQGGHAEAHRDRVDARLGLALQVGVAETGRHTQLLPGAPGHAGGGQPQGVAVGGKGVQEGVDLPDGVLFAREATSAEYAFDHGGEVTHTALEVGGHVAWVVELEQRHGLGSAHDVLLFEFLHEHTKLLVLTHTEVSCPRRKEVLDLFVVAGALGLGRREEVCEGEVCVCVVLSLCGWQ